MGSLLHCQSHGEFQDWPDLNQLLFFLAQQVYIWDRLYSFPTMQYPKLTKNRWLGRARRWSHHSSSKEEIEKKTNERACLPWDISIVLRVMGWTEHTVNACYVFQLLLRAFSHTRVFQSRIILSCCLILNHVWVYTAQLCGAFGPLEWIGIWNFAVTRSCTLS